MTSADDRHRAMEMLSTIGANTSSLSVVVHGGDPASKARARVMNGYAFTPKRTVAAQRALADRLRGIQPFPGNVAVSCVFHRSNRQRIDVDNLTKLVLDAATQANLWQDDSQVTAIVAVLEHDEANPRTVVAFAPHESSMKRGDDACRTCETCGVRFLPQGRAQSERGRFCSAKCRVRLVPIPCPHCATPFKPATAKSKFCSVACRSAWHSAQASEARAARTHCKRGHEMTDDNSYPMSNGVVRCRRCNADNATRYRNALGVFAPAPAIPQPTLFREATE